MKDYNFDNLNDISGIQAKLTREEVHLLLQGAYNVKRHLKRQIAHGMYQYMRNVEFINEVIDLHKRQLDFDLSRKRLYKSY